MAFKCNQVVQRIVNLNESNYGDDNDDIVPLITYRSIGIQTESPWMVDKAIQVYIPRYGALGMMVIRSPNDRPVNCRPVDLRSESPANEIDIEEEDEDVVDSIDDAADDYDESKECNNNNNSSAVNQGKRKQRASDIINRRVKKQFIGESSGQEDDQDDLRLKMISFDEEQFDKAEPDRMMISEDLGIGKEYVGADINDDGLEVDDCYIFTHHPTGLCYQIFNERRSVNKEMMEQVFASVIGKEDKYYLCLYPPHKGACHSSAGKSTKIRVVKNHLTSHLFLYRCRLCGRTYKYYNNLFNHFNKHP